MVAVSGADDAPGSELAFFVASFVEDHDDGPPCFVTVAAHKTGLVGNSIVHNSIIHMKQNVLFGPRLFV